MKTLSPSVSSLLDKLYNLRGEESVLLVEMDSQKNKAEETKTRTTKEKAELQTKITELQQQHAELEDQGERLKEVLSGINRAEFATVLDRLRIDFDPALLVEKLDRTLPKTVETVIEDTKKSEDALLKVEEEMNDSITTIEELGIRRDAALANQEKLNEYFELALTGRINITRDSITSLLEQFRFTEEEQREAAKILMFPEDALYSYEEKLQEKNRTGKSISEVIAEAKEQIEDPIQETIVIEEVEAPIVIEEVEEQQEPSKDIMHVLETLNIDYLDFSADEVNQLVQNGNEITIRENVGFIRSLSLDHDMFINNAGLMYDSELKAKIELLLSVGKDASDIYLNPNVLTKYNLQELSQIINMIKVSGMEAKTLPLMAY